ASSRLPGGKRNSSSLEAASSCVSLRRAVFRMVGGSSRGFWPPPEGLGGSVSEKTGSRLPSPRETTHPPPPGLPWLQPQRATKRRWDCLHFWPPGGGR